MSAPVLWLCEWWAAHPLAVVFSVAVLSFAWIAIIIWSTRRWDEPVRGVDVVALLREYEHANTPLFDQDADDE